MQVQVQRSYGRLLAMPHRRFSIPYSDMFLKPLYCEMCFDWSTAYDRSIGFSREEKELVSGTHIVVTAGFQNVYSVACDACKNAGLHACSIFVQLKGSVSLQEYRRVVEEQDRNLVFAILEEIYNPSSWLSWIQGEIGLQDLVFEHVCRALILPSWKCDLQSKREYHSMLCK